MPDRSGPMACPIDGAALIMSERQGIEIDYCPQCRGVWLDRGELDKIIERSAAEPLRASPPSADPQGRGRGRDHGDGQGHGWGRHGGERRRKSFLSELFD